MIVMTEAEAQALVDATPSGLDILRPVLIEGGPDAGSYAAAR